MGRLINADELIDNINGWYAFMQEVRHLPNYTLGQADIIAKINNQPTVEAIPKDQYEQRLKADMAAMLTEIQLEIEEKHKEEDFMNDWSSGYNISLIDTSDLIQQKINALKRGGQE